MKRIFLAAAIGLASLGAYATEMGISATDAYAKVQKQDNKVKRTTSNRELPPREAKIQTRLVTFFAKKQSWRPPPLPPRHPPTHCP